MIREADGRFWHDSTEITEKEYDVLLTEIKAKAALVEDIFSGIKTIDDCPAVWREEISERVEERRKEIDPDPDIDGDELLDILMGGAE